MNDSGRTAGRVVTEWSDDGVHVTATETFGWRDATGRWWWLPAGAVTDGASIPQYLWSVLGSPLTGEYRIAAFLHDAAYRTLGVTKVDADAMLKECALFYGTGDEEAEALWFGVHCFGLDAYARDQAAAGATAT